jgi:hypothetical protein
LCLREALGGLRRVGEELLERQRACGEELAKRVSFDALHGDPRDAVRRPDVVDRHDVRVVQRGGRAGLFLEALEPFLVRSERGRKDLDRDVAPEPGVPRAIDLSHAARAERREDLVRPEPSTRRDRHETGAAG